MRQEKYACMSNFAKKITFAPMEVTGTSPVSDLSKWASLRLPEALVQAMVA
jgi:hypothetical protein